MISNLITIKPISPHQWVPDRCLIYTEPFDPREHPPECGCPGINYSKVNSRRSLEQLYESTTRSYGCCGFVAWAGTSVIAYHTFFPGEVASSIGFFGSRTGCQPGTLISSCLSVVKGEYRRKGVASSLIHESLTWAQQNGWQRFEVHDVLPDCEKGWASEQKSCLTFWEKCGFRVFNHYPAGDETKKHYNVSSRFSLVFQLNS